ncbi:hypothetical protein MNBD_PLANCTO03-330, partial [hydrothermal vent metagenome]
MHHPIRCHTLTPVLALALGLGMTPATAQQTQEEIVYYDSMGFESPDYHLGPLPGYTYQQGQNLWVTI